MTQQIINTETRCQLAKKNQEKALKRIQKNNVQLIEECNSLRNENKKMQHEQRIIKMLFREILGDKFSDSLLHDIEEGTLEKGRASKTVTAKGAKATLKHSNSTAKLTRPPPGGGAFNRSKSTASFPTAPVSARGEATGATTQSASTARLSDNKTMRKLFDDIERSKQQIRDQHQVMNQIQVRRRGSHAAGLGE